MGHAQIDIFIIAQMMLDCNERDTTCFSINNIHLGVSYHGRFFL